MSTPDDQARRTASSTPPTYDSRREPPPYGDGPDEASADRPWRSSRPRGGGDEVGPYDQGSAQPYPAYGQLPEHPQGTLILIFGILGFFVNFLGPVAWWMGHRAQRDIAARGQHFSNEAAINVGKILGIIVTILLVVGLVVGIVVFAIVVAVGASQR